MYTKGMLAPESLKGKVVLITGGGTGLGKAMTTYFMQLGAKTAISSRRIDMLKDVAAQLEKDTGSECFPVQCDVRHADQVEQMKEKVLQHYGKIDVLVNNAAGNFISPTERLSSNAFKTIIEIVLMGTVNCTLAFGKHWIKEKQEKGNVLNIVTTYAWTGSGFVVPSACAKAGVLAMTRSLAVEWAKYNIRFNAIAPGPFPTKGAWDRLLPGDLKEKMDIRKQVPLQRTGEHPELANLAAYLISDYADYINGEVVTIDGGEWLQGAGEFNQLEMVPSEMWDMLEQMIRASKKQ